MAAPKTSSAIDMTGQTHGSWTVIARAPRVRTPQGTMPAKWFCRCRCGRERVLDGNTLRRYPSSGCRSCSKHIRPYEALFNVFVNSARLRGLECSITYEQFLSFTEIAECHYCAGGIAWTEHNLVRHGGAYHLDRKDNDQGYHVDNCVVCCKSCNRTKLHALSYDEMRVVGRMRHQRKVN